MSDMPETRETRQTPDLRCTWLGLELASPIVASSGPLTHDPEMVVRLVEAGAAAVILPSLFEEQVEHEADELERLYSVHSDSNIEAASFFPEVPGYESVVDVALRLVERTKARVDVPVVASVNGTHPGGWVRYASLLVDAGADAVELNMYTVAADPRRSAGELEADQVALVESLTRSLTVPVNVKLSPYYTSIGSFALALEQAGADGVSFFNRFYQPDLDLDTLSVASALALSNSDELRLPLRWLALLRQHLTLSMAATTGVHSGHDVAKAILAGADVAMTTSAVLRRGPEHVATMLRDLTAWMSEHDYTSVAQMRGAASSGSIDDPEAYERANYIGALARYTSRFHASG
jgi:dihydroorotate dehydrogenase (fumarate)